MMKWFCWVKSKSESTSVMVEVEAPNEAEAKNKGVKVAKAKMGSRATDWEVTGIEALQERSW